MSVAISAAAGPLAQASDVPLPLTQQEFVINLQNSLAAASMPQLANPAALAGELLGFLRGYVERSQSPLRAMRIPSADKGDGANLVQTASLEQSRPDLHGGPAREQLEPIGGQDSVAPTAAGSAGSNAQLLEHLDRLVEAQMASIFEGTLLTNGTTQVVHSFNTLLRGQ